MRTYGKLRVCVCVHVSKSSNGFDPLALRLLLVLTVQPTQTGAMMTEQESSTVNVTNQMDPKTRAAQRQKKKTCPPLFIVAWPQSLRRER